MWIELTIISLFITYSVTMGVLSKDKTSKDLNAYFLVDGELKSWQSGRYMVATQRAADIPLLVAELAYLPCEAMDFRRSLRDER